MRPNEQEEQPVPCGSCGRQPTVEQGDYSEWWCICRDCYDGGDETWPAGPATYADTRQDAIDLWHDLQLERGAA